MEPMIIQGGMGVGVSSWRLASEVARAGELGVVSGTAVAVTLARRLEDGDADGELSAALAAFPFPHIAERVLARVTRRGGGDRYRAVARPSLHAGRAFTELTVVANFVEVHLAKQGHDGLVGVNHLEKIQIPTLASLYGAMLADVDVVLMGAGIPARIPAVLDTLAANGDVSMPLRVADDDPGASEEVTFSPGAFADGAPLPTLRRPRFFAIVGSSTLAVHLSRAASGGPDGFVLEAPRAGGHNAPPRGRPALDAHGEPVYGPRDVIATDSVAALGKPFWLAGGFGTPEGLAAARAAGAAGIQVGTAFAFCEESGLDPALRSRVLGAVRSDGVRVRTDPVASPTGFPFKVVEVKGTIGDAATAQQRTRVCDLGYLREPYRRDDGRIGYRCAAEPVEDYVAKGGDIADTEGRRCLCNGLVASNGLAQQRRDGSVEAPLVTAGDDLAELAEVLGDGQGSYSAADVLAYLRSDPMTHEPVTTRAT